MKKRKIENTPPVKTKKAGWWTTVQVVDEIIVLNVYNHRKLQARHCIYPEKLEFATWKNGVWYNTKAEHAYGMETADYYYYYTRQYNEKASKRVKMSNEDKELIRNRINVHSRRDNILMDISSEEQEYARNKRQVYENNRMQRVRNLMNQIPAVPSDIKEWIDKQKLDSMNFCIKVKDVKDVWSCTACGHSFYEKYILRPDKTRPRNNDMVTCPRCKTDIKLLTRKKKIAEKAHFCIMQPVNDECSVARYCEAEINCDPGYKKNITLKENMRIILFKNPDKKWCDFYYIQCFTCRHMIPGQKYDEWFDNKGNPINRTADYMGYLYDDGIEEALKDTKYEACTRLFQEFAATGQQLNYNRIMIGCRNKDYMQVMELLYRGRFYKLLKEQSGCISVWELGRYQGQLKIDGKDIQTVFGIKDMQKINRIRQADGGETMLEWMQWSDETGEKVSENALKWLEANGISVSLIRYMEPHFSVEQIMNYIERQRKENYKGKSPKAVIEQYNDYISMCETLHKDTSDAMVYRPRELKRRHDEAVAEIELRRAEIKAEEYSKKFGEAEAVLQGIKGKYEFENDIYFIMVPARIVDIVTEGNYLHHCAGATDRYFDRIKRHETYICFLRKKEEPDIPYYTIEVEPGGTIRQHRGMYDEEPEIEQVKPFLREWQKEIRKRMSKEDHKRAAESKLLREANIKELMERNNTRVLNGLMEDFMEAEAVENDFIEEAV